MDAKDSGGRDMNTLRAEAAPVGQDGTAASKPDHIPHVLDTVTDARVGILVTAPLKLLCLSFQGKKSGGSERLLHSTTVTQETS